MRGDRALITARGPRALCALSVVLLSAYCASSAQQQAPEERGAWCRLVEERWELVQYAELSPADTAIIVVEGWLARPADRDWLGRNGSFPFEGKRYFGAGYGRWWGAPDPRPARGELIPLGEHDGATLYGWPTGDDPRKVVYVFHSRPGMHEPCRLFYFLEAREIR
jgi:hypothetical protein